MKVISALLILSLSSTAATSQVLYWTWMKGDSSCSKANAFTSGVYGTMGVEASSNKPGYRETGVTWTDAAGKLWLFGGWKQNTDVYYNDVWKFNPTTNSWTWMKDDTLNLFGVYGTKGVAGAANQPGARYGSISWKDASGNVWMFGGTGYAASGAVGELNDLWKYNTTTNQWTWMNGPTTTNSLGVYGTKGIAAALNQPGARHFSVSWMDASGNLWLMGGDGYAGSVGALNDLWKYDPVASEWTWVGGSNTTNAFGVYGTVTTGAPTNQPGARSGAVSWTDASGNFWLFGGQGNAASASGYMNDLWKYVPSTGLWTWMKGDNTVNQSGNYGFQFLGLATNKPGAKYLATPSIDATGDLWLFAGYGQTASGLFDLLEAWKYSPSSNNWTWIYGNLATSTSAVYGTQATPASANRPGGREGAMVWRDGSDNFWGFAGYGYTASSQGFLNDLWTVRSSPLLPVQLISFTGSVNNRDVNLQWQTAQEINTAYYNLQRSFNGSEFTTVRKVTAQTTSSANKYRYLDVDALKNNSTTYYRLQMTDKDGTTTYSNVLKVSRDNTRLVVSVFPNPAHTTLNMSVSNNTAEKGKLALINMAGLQVRQESLDLVNGSLNKALDITQLPAGTYVLSLTTTTTKVQEVFVKQ